MKHYKDILDYARVKIEKKNHIEADKEKVEEKSNGSKTRKHKLFENFQQAMLEHDDWHCKFLEIQKNKTCMLAKDIWFHCKRIKGEPPGKNNILIVKIPLI